ncbi:nitroreductase/quinone reductase family protein [Nocardia fluminea]|uniref:nitroreductase/quinone reductase family protein n=1 Tax=Nocardia fluminea TaxID=134984 RepID=UPI000C706A01
MTAVARLGPGYGATGPLAHRVEEQRATGRPPPLLETTGRRTGLARRTPIGGRRVGDSFWLVSDHGTASPYVLNIVANPRVRLRVGARWHTGTAHPLPADDSRARLRELPRFNSMMVRALGTNLLTIRIDLDPNGKP